MGKYTQQVSKFWAILVLTGALTFLFQVSHVFAYNYLGGFWPGQTGSTLKLNLGLDANMGANASQAYTDGFISWNSAGAEVSFTPASSTQSYNVLLTETNNSSVGWDGLTTLLPCNSCQYTSGTVLLNRFFTGSYVRGKIAGVATHELGHVIGLAHAGGCVIMVATTATRWDTCHLQTPQLDDINGAKARY